MIITKLKNIISNIGVFQPEIRFANNNNNYNIKLY